MIYLSLGSNQGNRLTNLRLAIKHLKKVFRFEKISHVIETDALLLPGSPESWNVPYLNMMVAGNTDLSCEELLQFIKQTEAELGRNMKADKWSPRIIDIDIVMYHDQIITDDKLTVPHPQIANRPFWKYLLKMLGYEIEENVINIYKALNYMVLEPKILKIVNVTPDSFSDGGKFLKPEDAIKDIEQSYNLGATYIDIGAQSTRPGYIEVSAREEIKRLEPVIKNISKQIPLSIDTYFDEVVNFFIKESNVHIINDVKFNLSDATLKQIADRNLKIITMMYGIDLKILENQIKYLRNRGISNIIVDPGIGFGKTKFENIEILKKIDDIKSLGCEILIAHSRKSFFELCSNSFAADRDIETVAVSDFVMNYDVDYLRVHNLQYHMRFLTAKKMMQL